MKYGRYVTAGVTIAAVVANAAPADAHSSAPGNQLWANALFRVGNFDGCVGQTQGGMVRGLQVMLWASGGYGAPNIGNKNQIDGVWGQKTRDAVAGFQWKNGLPIDGCAGSTMYNAMVNVQLRDVGVFPGTSKRKLKYQDTSNPAWMPGSTSPVIRIVKDDSSHGCFWYDWSGWRTFLGAGPAQYAETTCWREVSHESGPGHDHSGLTPTGGWINEAW